MTIAGVPVAVTGNVEATSSGGAIVLADIVLHAAGPQQIQGRTVANGHAFLSAPVLGTFDAPGHYVIPISAGRFLLNARVDGDQVALRATNTSEITGSYDETLGLFTVSGVLQDVSHTTTAVADLVLGFRNLPPVATITAPLSAECDRPGLAHAHLSATGSSDPNGADDIVHFLWILDRGTVAEVAFSAVEADVPLSLGRHEVQLFVTDRSGATSGAMQFINSEDTEGPILEGLTLTPACLWPPNHKLAHFKVGRELQFVARDRCHPGGETVRVASITSSERENGIGDGNTQPDGVITADGFCVRSERSGQSSAGRTYVVEFEALDAVGNRSDTSATVTSGVEHDQRGSRCDAASIESVDDGDPACAPRAEASESPSSALGCTAFPSAPFLLALVLLNRGVRRQRRVSC